MMKLHRMELVVAMLGVAFISSTALGGMISPTVAPVPSGPGLGQVSIGAIITSNTNNDNQLGGGPADNNIVIPLKRFDNSGAIDIVFTLGSTDGTTEYKVTEFVDNNTGSPWSSYKMQLGTGFGGTFVPFTSGALDFDAGPPGGFDTQPIAGAFPTVALGAYELNFTGGVQGTGAQQNVFRLDIPDGGNTFTLRQIPTAVPEPGMFALIGCVMLGAMAKRRVR